MVELFRGVRPLTQAVRDLSVASRLMIPVLTEYARYGQAASIAQIAETLGVKAEDARLAAVSLEAIGMIESTHFRIVAVGQKALKDQP